MARPSPADLVAAANRTIPDVLPGAGEPLRVLFCGINPSLYSAATGWHFARPGNRFWPALHLSGFTPRRLAPAEQDLLGDYGLGITNLVARATAQAAELDPAELRAGGERLAGRSPTAAPASSPWPASPPTAPPSAAPAPPSALRPTPWAAPGSGSSPTPAASTLIQQDLS